VDEQKEVQPRSAEELREGRQADSGRREERLPITEDWLKAMGFKWSQFDRQPDKMWLLWIGDALVEHGEPLAWRSSDYEDLGVEVAANLCGSGPEIKDWFCWLRSDSAGRYHRFIHLRHIVFQDELIAIIEGLTGRRFDPANIVYGSMKRPESARRLKEESQRLDLVIRHESGPHAKWYEHEKDDSRGRALPEHIDSARKGGLAK